MARQQEILTKVKEQISFHSLMNLPKILGVAEAYIDTNVDKKTILAIGKGLMDGHSNGVDTLRIPVASSFENKHVNVGAVLDIDLEKNKSELEKFLSTEDDVQMSKLEGVSS